MEHVSSVHPTGKFPEKVENLKRWAHFPGWISCSIYTFLIVCTISRSTVGRRDMPGFTNKWNNFLPIGHSTFAPTEISVFFFFLNGKCLTFEHVASSTLKNKTENGRQWELWWWVEFFSREGGRHCYILTNDNNKKDHKIKFEAN